mmetsp:Transcript_11882/g.40951  ORF Transcript_11882/g.40951 Transcript_11882/m.40951 type:complete len:379 (+) Transcript_11882:182-1318(+)
MNIGMNVESMMAKGVAVLGLDFSSRKFETASDYVKCLQEEAGHCSEGKEGAEKSMEELAQCLSQLKMKIKLEDGKEKHKEFLDELSALFAEGSTLQVLIRMMTHLDFEARKDVSFIFRVLLRSSAGPESFSVAYLAADFDRDEEDNCLVDLLKNYRHADSISTCCGLMLRDCAKYEDLAKRLLQTMKKSAEAPIDAPVRGADIFTYVQLPQFDIASDAFSTLRDLLVIHKKTVATFLEQDFDFFFRTYSTLLTSDSYVTKRQALRLLGDILLDRNNYKVMTRYISEPEHLKVMMNLLRAKEKAIRNDSFHIFKVFVVNPNKGEKIQSILLKNKAKLVTFMMKFRDEEEDEQLQEDCAAVLEHIQKLEDKHEGNTEQGN